MEQEVISIRRFGGMFTNPTQEDIPLEASAYNLNCNPHADIGFASPKAAYGRLTGIPANGDAYIANGTQIPDVTEAAWIKYEESAVEKWDLIFIDLDDNDITIS